MSKRLEDDVDKAKLWSDSMADRLCAQRELTSEELQCLRVRFPRAWTFGNATSINPLVVVLGASPGASGAHTEAMNTKDYWLPSAGAHEHVVHYQDAKNYWERVRHLARTLLHSAGSGNDALALFGLMNLDPDESGQARDVEVKCDHAKEVLAAIRHLLRPRFLVCLGLKGKLGEEVSTRSVFDGAFDLDSRKPEQALPWEWRTKRYSFDMWDVLDTTMPLRVVLWPQHPSRMSLDAWRDACARFQKEHGRRLRV